ncbi:hypothetical protein AFLA_012549 [Aspergillus flavus NRRL3357]|nr:hypothetical protein AFLA_012549 [Aspergillus flavus NRRL3357]
MFILLIGLRLRATTPEINGRPSIPFSFSVRLMDTHQVLNARRHHSSREDNASFNGISSARSTKLKSKRPPGLIIVLLPLLLSPGPKKRL